MTDPAPSDPAQPGLDQPGPAQPSVDQPGFDQPSADQPGVDQPGADQPGVAASDPASERAARAEEAERRRRRDRVFGAVLADTTADERGHGSPTGDRSRDDELRRNVPPHHG